jgi:hypothetical protein
MKRGWGGRLALVAAIVMSALALSPARADVVVQIDKSSQRMAVSVDGATRYNWPVSTGRSGHGTPSGVFHPQSMARHYFSRKYYNFLLLRLRHSRHQRPRPARRSRVAWLRQAAPLACGGAVRVGPAQRTSQYAHRNQLK